MVTPPLIFLDFAADRLVIHILDLARHGACLAFANLAEVNFAQTDALGGGSAHEDLIRNVKLVTGNGLFQNPVSQILCNGVNGMTCDAFKYWRSGRRNDLAMSYYEKILARTFGDETLRIEHDRFLEAEPL